MRSAIIYNPHSGHNQGEAAARQLQTALRNRGDDVTLLPTKAPGSATTLAKEADADLVVAIGGDGTVREVISGLSPRKQPPLLGIMPKGTVNNLAKTLHIPLTNRGAINNILEGTPQFVDIGQINNTYMVSTLTLGVLANAALAVTQREKQRFGPLAFLFKGLRVLGRHQHWHLTLESPHHHWDQDTQFVLIAMTNSVGGFTNFNPDAAPDDGMFHVFVAPKLTWRKTFLVLPYFITGNFAKFPGMTYFRTDELRITTRKHLRSRIDGDPSVSLPINGQVVKNHIQVITPTSTIW
ncbi:diacylglycerol/lipid kinase family protein [Lacticaseibacillus brantae]|uniref:Lipid kinase from diacylglycerol kinase family n=1 Tax=Lacticaseibacillus brantae DSM 23927 TaxID=1423727 RepID=A0A0R2AXV9_9LACO|nr:diacylglycerol kinase family protein [Lacticaseibacillus brantae]KRM72206.1 lipid kinase from diacylglycerol kinase family [Lacticaseibacillus brantae DSM 23927]